MHFFTQLLCNVINEHTLIKKVSKQFIQGAKDSLTDNVKGSLEEVFFKKMSFKRGKGLRVTRGTIHRIPADTGAGGSADHKASCRRQPLLNVKPH